MMAGPRRGVLSSVDASVETPAKAGSLLAVQIARLTMRVVRITLTGVPRCSPAPW